MKSTAPFCLLAEAVRQDHIWSRLASNLLSSQGWPWTHTLPASTCQTLELQIGTTTARPNPSRESNKSDFRLCMSTDICSVLTFFFFILRFSQSHPGFGDTGKHSDVEVYPRPHNNFKNHCMKERERWLRGKSTGYSSRRPRCNSQHPHDSLQPSETPLLRDPLPFSARHICQRPPPVQACT